jgi:RNA polymerase sigma factor (sigma-70 family)
MRPGRDEAFERLYAEHAQALYAFLSYRTGDRVLAEDLLADTFERALRARWRFDRRRASAKTWLYTIALNLLRDHTRRRAREARALHSVAAEASAGSNGGIELLADRDLVARGLPSLSDQEREAIALRFGAELTVPEIAKLTGQPLTTVEGRVYKALRKLRETIDQPVTRARLTGRYSQGPPQAPSAPPSPTRRRSNRQVPLRPGE